MSSVKASRLEQTAVLVDDFKKIEDLLRKWNASGWRAITISAVGSVAFGGRRETEWYILFERYV
jgi:hypothetical protein